MDRLNALNARIVDNTSFACKGNCAGPAETLPRPREDLQTLARRPLIPGSGMCPSDLEADAVKSKLRRRSVKLREGVQPPPHEGRPAGITLETAVGSEHIDIAHVFLSAPQLKETPNSISISV
jgi:hypothetical protein